MLVETGPVCRAELTKEDQRLLVLESWNSGCEALRMRGYCVVALHTDM